MTEIDFNKSELELIKDFVKYPNDYRFPVGTILTSEDDNFNPETEYGGEWEKIEDRFLLGAGDGFKAGSTGGEITHTLTVAEMPNHTHAQKFNNTYGETYNGPAATENKYSNNYWFNALNTGATGGSQPHNNMPPYKAMYMWIKTKSEKELKENIYEDL